MSHNGTCLQSAFEIVVCVPDYITCMFLVLKEPCSLKGCFFHETQQRNSLLKAEIYCERDGEFCKVHVLCCVSQLLIAATSLSLPS